MHNERIIAIGRIARSTTLVSILMRPSSRKTHWTSRAMAKTTGISLRSVQRIWAAHDLQPHHIRTFKRSTDPEFAAKLDNIVGL